MPYRYVVSQEYGTWTPSFKVWDHPGDLKILPAFAFGTYTKSGKTCTCHFNLSSRIEYTSSVPGQLTIKGLPYAATHDFVGTLVYSGINKAPYTGFAVVTAAEMTELAIECSGNGLNIASLRVTDVPSGTVLTMRGTVIYETYY